MRSLSVRRLLAALFLGLLLTGPAGGGLASPVGAIVAPNGGCDDGACGR